MFRAAKSVLPVPFKVLVLAVAGAFAGSAGTVLANPTGANTVSGSAIISNPSASVLQIRNTPGTIIQWNGFSIQANETTRFVQDNAASAVLNRVVGGTSSSILGQLRSNGRVFLVNPNGIVFGGSSVVDVAGLIASTRDISNANFAAGNYTFSGSGNGNITLQDGARITTSGSGGQVWLIANKVTAESGSRIESPQGQVVLAAGQQVTVGSGSMGNMTFSVNTGAANTIDALGEIVAQRGAVGFFADTINFEGLVSARADSEGKGQIVARASSDINVKAGARLDAGADGAADAGSILLQATRKITVDPASEVLAESPDGKGGTVTLRAYQVDLPGIGASINETFDAPSFTFQHGHSGQSVRAYGRSADDDGTVTVDETGSFTYALSTSALAQTDWEKTFEDGEPRTGYDSSHIHAAGRAGDGAVLVAKRSHAGATTGTNTHTFSIIQGSSAGSDLNLVPENADVLVIKGLAKGGWAVESIEAISDGGSVASRVVRIVDASGQVRATFTNDANSEFVSIVPLPSGAVWIRQHALLQGTGNVDPTPVSSRVVRADGTELTGSDRTAALGGVRTVDLARVARASASGPAFVALEPTRTEVEESGNRTVTVTSEVELRRGGDKLASLPEGSYEETLKYDSSGLRTETETSELFFQATGMTGTSALVFKLKHDYEKADVERPGSPYRGDTIEYSGSSELHSFSRTPTSLPTASTSVSASLSKGGGEGLGPNPAQVVRGSGPGAALDLSLMEQEARNAQQEIQQHRLPVSQPPTESSELQQVVDRFLDQAGQGNVPEAEREALRILAEENGDLRLLLEGSSFGPPSTPEERQAAVAQWLENERTVQQLGESEGANPADVSRTNEAIGPGGSNVTESARDGQLSGNDTPPANEAP